MTPIPKPTSSHQKGVKMKSTPTQPKKKIAMTKAVNDSISDTISSVIQGKSTHQKPASPKKLVKNDKPKVIKKLCTRKAPSSSIPTPKNDNANVTRAYNAKVEASSPKKQQEKPVKAVKQLKPNLSPDVKSQIKPTNVVKRQISPVKVVTAIADKDKPTTNVSKERTSNKVSEKKEKSAPAKNKTIAANKTTKMEKNKVLADQKLIKQNLVTKPKKVVQNNKSGVKKKILKSKPVALPKKIIKTITQKRKLPVKDVKDDTSNPPKLATPTNCTVTSPSSTSIDKVSTASNSVLKEEVIKKEPLDEPNSAKLVKVKEERDSDSENKLRKVKPLPKVKSKPNSMMIKRLLGNQSVKNKKQSKKMKLYNMWNGPKRHRVASLNALAKVHCLYENESRSVLIDQIIDGVKKENTTKIKSEDEAPCSSTRQLRTAPGLRGVGKHWEMHESSSSSSRSSSSSEEDEYEFKETIEKPCLRKIRRIRDNYKVKEKIGESNKDSNDETETVAPTKAKRPRKPKKKPDSPIMDLKDLIVPKRMASLNASAILAASYSVEKRSNRPPNSDSEDSTDSGDSYFKEPIPEDEQLEQIVKMEQEQACADERAKHMVQAPPNSKKVAVILNQDTDVTITGVYVNSTRSTHHEGFCSIAGMQYRISATSHTQTAATAVTSETILQSASSGEHSTTNGDSTSTSTGPVPTQQPNKSYTPLDALSSMQPPSGSTSSSSANLQQAPSTSGPQPQQQQPLINPHHNHHHSHNRQHISSPPGGPHTLHPLHQPQQQQYHHHHHHLSGPPPGHYHHPHQLVVAQYPPQQYYPHPGTIAHGGKSRYGLYHHHHHPSGDRGTYSNSSDNSAFSVPPGGLFPNSTSAGVASTVSSSSSVVAANSGGGQPPPPTASQSSAGSGSESEIGSSSGYVHGYYQPAGPLISLSHGHSQPTPLVKTQPADPPSSISPLPSLPPHKIQPPSSTGDSSDNEVIITSVTTINNKDSSASTNTTSRLSPSTALTQHPSSTQLPPSSHPSYRSAPYHPQYPPTTYTTYPPPSSYSSPYHSPYYSPYPPNHHELCYPAPGGGYVTAHKYPPPSQSAAASAYRRYLASNAGGYYVTTAPEIYGGQGPGPGPGPGGQQGVGSTLAAPTIGSGASSNSSGSYQTASPHQQPQSGGSSLQGPGQPPPPTIIETYTPPPPPPALLDSYPPPPPPSHYYPGYGPAAPPPPNCYTTHPHHSPSRGVPFLNATYPPCPCPMQSCPKNVHTGPLTGDCKRSAALQIAKATTLPPVALALPLEPASATGPPSPARGSAGMPPPPSPAGATYQPLPPSSSEPPSTSTHTIHEMLPQLKNEQTSDSESTSNTETQTTQISESTAVANHNVDVVHVKPEEKRRKARVGKAMVRNSIQQQLNSVVHNGSGNTMLLMCNPNSETVNQTTFISDVKREVESPEGVQTEIVQPKVRSEKNVVNEVLIVPEDLSTSKEQPNILNGHVQNNQTNVEPFPVQAEPIVIQDVKTEKISEPPQVLEVAKPTVVPIEVLEPCQKTVAENVKVKNMKRKLSINNNNNTEEKKLVEETPTPAKKSKSNLVNINNNIPINGSYKDLIKKGSSTVKINNGRRKLITTNGGKLQSRIVPSKFPKKRTPIKRKASIPLKDETNSKRVKLNPKPLATNNSKDSNHPAKEVKENTFIDTSLIENKEPPAKPKAKNGRRTSSNGIIKTNVDRTIESVVNQKASSSVRTEKPPTRSRSNEKQKEALKEKEDKLITNAFINSGVKRAATVKTSKTKVTELVVPIPSVVSVTNVSTPSADSFVKPCANPCTSKSHCALPSTCFAGCVSDLCLPSTSKGVGSKQSAVRKRKAVPLSIGSVACGTRSLKASAALAAASVTPAAIAKTGRRSLQQPRWSNGWTWEGEPFQRDVFLNSDDTVVVRKCYPSMRHREGDTIEPRDCVLLKAGPRKNDLPYVAKVAALWENPEDGEMMMSLLWYYRPEHTEQGRTCADQPDEVFASRHKDSNSVACIEDKCYVLTFNEYCRYRKTLRRLEEGLADTSPCIPLSEPYTRDCRQPPKQVPTSSEMIFFCRRVYDFRQKRIVKNPS